MKSHAILRTNVGLTTNVKIMVNTKYSLYLDAIISNSELSSTKFKRLEFNKDTYWDEVLPKFFRETDAEIAFDVRDNSDSDNMSSDFANQYDDLYEYGARNIIENKDYIEEYEYFAPLYISKNNLPKNFIIFRVDGSGLTRIDSTNFKTEVLDKMKVVRNFDLTRKTVLGEWLEKNFLKNKSFPLAPFDMDFRNLEFSSWFGIDFEDGGYSEKSFMFDEVLEFEQLYHDFEKFVYDGYKTNKVVFPNILNFSFLFDDEPATPTSLRKWSINRYLGFYMDDLELVKSISPYLLPKIKDDVTIDENNLLISASSDYPFLETWKKNEFPYLEIGGKFYKIEKYFEEGEGVLTRVLISNNTYEERIEAPLISKWKIISEDILAGRESEMNKNLIKITSVNGINTLKYEDESDFDIDEFDEADVWLIKIDDMFHRILKVGSEFRIHTDYAFYQSINKFDYYINDPDPKYRKSISLKVDDQNEPVKFEIYRCKFTDIKDFDYNIIDTDYSKFEYILKDELTQTDEPKMYSTDWASDTNPKNIDDYKLNGFVVEIPSSSEYTATSETFKISDSGLSTLWKKNPQRVKWGFQNSISSNDYPYLLNNCFLSESFNRTTNPLISKPSRSDRNLDYFLTINPDSSRYSHHSLHVVDDEIIKYEGVSDISGQLVLDNISNIGKFNIKDRILINNTIECVIMSIDVNKIRTSLNFSSNFTLSGVVKNLTRTTFSLDKYLNVGYEGDYFTYFFGKKTSFDSGNIVKTTKKWSLFNESDSDLPNITLFRGIKYLISEVNSLKIDRNGIKGFNIKNKNTFKDWKFSVLASTNNFMLRGTVDDEVELVYSNSNLVWQQIEEWRPNKIYATGSLVVFDEILYESSSQSVITDPSIFPYSSTDWMNVVETIFFTPLQDGSTLASGNFNNAGIQNFSVNIPAIVYNYGEYYYSTLTPNGVNFWIPSFFYGQYSIVYYKGKFWKSNTGNVGVPPTSNRYFGAQEPYWYETAPEPFLWEKIRLWSRIQIYDRNSSVWAGAFDRGHYVLHRDIIWFTNTSTQRGVEPQNDSAWTRIYSLDPDTNFEYSTNFNSLGNPIIRMNNRLYKIKERITTSTPTNFNKTLDNGITVYVNRKWKNILVNIYINDNTLTSFKSDNIFGSIYYTDYLSNVKRDSLYTEVFEKLSADNFIISINDFENLYDFSDKIKYVVIEEDLSLKLYDFNDLTTIQNIPVLLSCQTPDIFETRISSNIIKPENLSIDQIKAKRELIDGNISSISELNYYDGKHLGVTIAKNEIDPMLIPNYSKLQNRIFNNLYRHSGYYSPIFNHIELFESPGLTSGGGNYKFDTSLTYFGQIKERILSKVSRKGNILKLRNKRNLKSIYPMLDEFGYQVDSFFIFKSTWDYDYHVECNELPKDQVILTNQSINYNPNQVTQNNSQSEL